MKHDIALLKADIMDELSKLQRVADEFSPFTERLDCSENEVSNYDKMVVGYLLHSFYSVCENIFRLIARFFENDIETGTWHRDLLKRMSLEIPGYRPRVISENLLRLLDDFRGFRHRFRHCYSFELDWEREKVVAKRLERTLVLLKQEINLFLEQLDSLDLN